MRNLINYFQYDGSQPLPMKDSNQIPGSNNESTLRRSSLQVS